jgi:hypothetical protein
VIISAAPYMFRLIGKPFSLITDLSFAGVVEKIVGLDSRILLIVKSCYSICGFPMYL